MTISVTENQDGTFTIDWDQNDPKESVLNHWTEEDFIECIRSHCEKIIAESDDPDNEQVAVEDAIEAAIQGYPTPVRKDEEDERTPRLFF
jgi:hypothetical protein